MRRVIPLASSTCRARRPRPVPFQVSATPSASSHDDIDCDRADDLHGAVFFPGTSPLYFHALSEIGSRSIIPFAPLLWRVPDYSVQETRSFLMKEKKTHRRPPANVRACNARILFGPDELNGLGSDSTQ